MPRDCTEALSISCTVTYSPVWTWRDPIHMPNKQRKQGRKTKQPQQPNINTMMKNAVTAAVRSLPGAQRPQNSFLGDVGQFAGNGIFKIFGMGAYKMSKNSLYSSKTGSQVPFMHSTNESITFRHREYIGEVSSSIAFTTATYPVNPGMSATFPYLSTIA